MNNYPEKNQNGTLNPETVNRTGAINDDVVLCSDGVYRWIYELPMGKAFFLLFEVWRCLFLAALIVGVFIAVFNLTEGTPLGDSLLFAAETIGIVGGILLVLSLPAYWIVVRANNGKYTVLFELDEATLCHTQIKTEKAKALDVLTMFAGAAAGSFTATGIGMMNVGGGSLTSHLSRVRKIKSRHAKNYIRVNGLLIRNMVYVKDSDFDFVMDYLVQHCPKAKVVRG